MSQLPATKANIKDIIDEYKEKHDAIPGLIGALEKATDDLKYSCMVQGEYAYTPIKDQMLRASDLRLVLLKSAWWHIYKRLHADDLLPASDRALFERSMDDPPPLTMENIAASFGDLVTDTRGNVLRGLAEAFVKLDKAYMSHESVKIGADRLPKRIIVHNVMGDYMPSYGADHMYDAVKAVLLIGGWTMIMRHDFRDIIKAAANSGEVEPVSPPAPAGDDEEKPLLSDMSVRVYKNGNGHLIFGHESLRVVNQALAEYYGEVLPDAWERPGSPDNNSTAVAKDLQFYRTPDEIADDIASLLDFVCKPGMRVLDPSCGDGSLLDAVRRRFKDARTAGIEVHRGRAIKCRSRHHVTICNFLEVEPAQIYDAVVMNPPFYGRHWVKHVKHALKFVKPVGKLVTILPASAVVDHMDLLRSALDYHRKNVPYRMLPAGAFAESGTNICTVIVELENMDSRA